MSATGDTVQVEIAPPLDEPQIIGSTISIGAFNADCFAVVVKTKSQRVQFHVPLADWLAEIATYFRAGRNDYMKGGLDITGEAFSMRREGDDYAIQIWDRAYIWLVLSPAELRSMHEQLTAKLVSTLRRAAGGKIEILHLEDLSLDGGDAHAV